MTLSNETLAREIVHTLNEAGFIAYFAGGWVRDHLLGIPTEEIDIATNAPPSTISSLFPKTVPVGIAFGVVIVVKGGINFEVTTFRKDLGYVDGRHPEGIAFSSPQEDAKRRDFTINGMFYNPLTHEVHDFVGGQEDLKKKVIRSIGSPFERFSEDRLRLLRAIRFAARFDFAIEKETWEALCLLSSSLLPAVSVERIWQELTKMSQKPHFDKALFMLEETGLLRVLFPSLDLTSLRSSLSSFSFFPKDTPLIVYLLELFPQATLKERLALCDTFKTSGADRKIVECFYKWSQPLSKVERVYFYAHPLSSLFLLVQEAKLPFEKRQAFHKEHEELRAQLGEHIERIQKKEPLVTASVLEKEGVSPGPKMGRLLKEAERICIEEDKREISQVIKELKKSLEWQK